MGSQNPSRPFSGIQRYVSIIFDSDKNVFSCGGEMKFPSNDSVVSPSLLGESLVISNALMESSSVMIPVIPYNSTQEALDFWSLMKLNK